MPAKHDHITYEGPTSRSDSSEVFVIDGVTLRKGVPTQVEGDLLDELRAGTSDRLKGQKFSVGPAPGDDGDDPDTSS